VPIMHLHIQNEEVIAPLNACGWNLDASIISDSGDVWNGWIGGLETTANGKIRRVYCDSSLPDGPYSLDASYSEFGRIELRFQHRRGAGAETKFLSMHSLAIDSKYEYPSPFDSIQVRLCCRGICLREILLLHSDIVNCIVEQGETYDVFLHHSDLGWAEFRSIPFDTQSIDLGNVHWNQGGTIQLQPPVDLIDSLPCRIELRHVSTGVSHQFDNFGWNDDVLLENVMPGTWEYKLISLDVIEGDKTILTKRLELEAGKTIRFP
jgi:hypothetical protein